MECSRDWYEQYRSDLSNKDSRRNPLYCFEAVPFKTTHHVGEYDEAVKLGRIADYSQYAGHELADLDGCIGAEEEKQLEKKIKMSKRTEMKKKTGEMMVDKKKCRQKFLPLMKHHNIEDKECGSKAECQAITDK